MIEPLLFDCRKCKNSVSLTNWCMRLAHKQFLTVTLYVSILGHMLLRNININEAIANILLYRKSLCDLPSPRCKNSEAWENVEKGVVNCGQHPIGQNIYPSQISSLWVPWTFQVVKCRVGSCISGTVTRTTNFVILQNKIAQISRF